MRCSLSEPWYLEKRSNKCGMLVEAPRRPGFLPVNENAKSHSPQGYPWGGVMQASGTNLYMGDKQWAFLPLLEDKP